MRKSVGLGIAVLAGLLLLALNSSVVTSPPPVLMENQAPDVKAGVMFQGRPLLRFSDGVLAELDVQTGARREMMRGVVDIAKAGGGVWVLQSGAMDVDSKQAAPRSFVLSRWAGRAAATLPALEVSGDNLLVALVVSGNQPLVVFQRDIWRFDSATGAWDTRPLEAELKVSRARVADALQPPGTTALYIAIDDGEFGGGLRNIDLATGQVQSLESGDPVKAIVADTEKGCVLAAVGLVHLTSRRGRVLRICGNDMTQVYERTIPGDNTEAILALAASKMDIWAVGLGTVKKFSAGRLQRMGPLRWHQKGDLFISRQIPGALLISSDMPRSATYSALYPVLVH